MGLRSIQLYKKRRGGYGAAVDPTRCRKRIVGNGWDRAHQCKNKGRVEEQTEEGETVLVCKRHSSAVAEAKAHERSAICRAEDAARKVARARRRLELACFDAVAGMTEAEASTIPRALWVSVRATVQAEDAPPEEEVDEENEQQRREEEATDEAAPW